MQHIEMTPMKISTLNARPLGAATARLWPGRFNRADPEPPGITPGKTRPWPLAWLLVAFLLSGCASFVYDGTVAPDLAWSETRIFVPEFANATDDLHAGRALTELTTTALLERGLPVVQREVALQKSRLEQAAGEDGLYFEAARDVQATHLLLGTIHEYRYKTDLDGDPVVGLTLRLVRLEDGLTLWQGSSGRVKIWFGSLSSAGQRAVRRLVARIEI